MTHRYETEAEWMHDQWRGMADDAELTITAGGLRLWMAQCLERSMLATDETQAVEPEAEEPEQLDTDAWLHALHRQPIEQDCQDEAGPTLYEGRQPEPQPEPQTVLERWLEVVRASDGQ